MKATVTKQFDGRADNEFVVRTFKVGEEITGDLAAVAVKQRWARAEGAAEPPPAPAPRQQTAPAPRQGQGGSRQPQRGQQGGEGQGEGQ